MYTIVLQGGLGNWMFQIAFSEYLKKTFGVDVRLCTYGRPGLWSTTDLLSNVFKNWKHLESERTISTQLTEQKLEPIDWNKIIPIYRDLHIDGYFQNYEYITHEFLSKLTLPTDSLVRHPNIGDTVFLHIRGGDYINIPSVYHDATFLDDYYSRSLKEFPPDTKFSVFSNDLKYTNTKNFLKGVSYQFINESEVDSLYLMSQCKGGICANSTFSWWGAFLNRNRKLIIPSKWFNDTSLFAEGYYFNEATIISV